MKTTGWKCTEMPRVSFWVEAIEDPQRPCGMDAEVTLPNGQTVVVENVRFDGYKKYNDDQGAYRLPWWSGTIKREPRP